MSGQSMMCPNCKNDTFYVKEPCDSMCSIDLTCTNCGHIEYAYTTREGIETSLEVKA